jgi:hypothetical protein
MVGTGAILAGPGLPTDSEFVAALRVRCHPSLDIKGGPQPLIQSLAPMS